MPDAKWGEVGKAFVVLNDDEKIEENELHNYCIGNLAKYKIPKYYQIINELPKNEAGKIDKKVLLKIHKKSTN